MRMLFQVIALFSLFYIQAGFASLTDPTRPLVISEKVGSTIQSWELQAIIISKGRRIAIFNGETLHLGSEVSGFKVVAIDPNTVHLEGPDGKMTLFLFNQTIKKSVDEAI